jgi:hypothetical protein
VVANQCQASNQAGKPCSAQHWWDCWCRWHHPELAEERRAWSAKGGHGKSNRECARKSFGDVLSPTDLQGLLSVAIKSTLGGRLEPGRANAVASLARALVGIRESAELEARLCEVERAAGMRRIP